MHVNVSWNAVVLVSAIRTGASGIPTDGAFVHVIPIGGPAQHRFGESFTNIKTHPWDSDSWFWPRGGGGGGAAI